MVNKISTNLAEMENKVAEVSMGKMFRLLREKSDQPYTLFHALNGTRKLELDKWLDAEQKTVFDGSRGKKYRSGFHTMPTLPDLEKLLRLFRRTEDLVVVEIDVDGKTWPKSHSRFNIQLVEKMKISSNAWRKRIYVDKRRKMK